MKRLGWLLVCLMLWACDNIEDSIYHGYDCAFFFDTTLHPAPCQLTMALGNPGHFLIVKATMVSGIRHIQTVRNYDHATEDIPLRTEPENKTRCLLGANNAIIIGRSSYTSQLVCYEGQCANCLNDFGGNNYPLTWSDNGQQLQCARCHRSYDVNNGVVAAGDGGHQLYNYRAAYDGAVLHTWN